MIITGHRGAKNLAPENTLIGIEVAAKAGAGGVEIDTQLSSDGVPMIFHDPTLTRCSNFNNSALKDGSDRLADYLMVELKELDVGGYFSSEFSNTVMPTLSEALRTCTAHGLNLNLEIKTHPFNSDDEIKALVDKVVRTIERNGYANGDNELVLSSFSLTAVKYCKDLAPNIKRGVISYDLINLNDSPFNQLSLYSVHMGWQKLTEDFCQQAKDLGLKIYIWTLNDIAEKEKFEKWGVDNIITDDPLKMI